MQYGFHDGRSLLEEEKLNLRPGDSCVLEVPSQKVIKILKMEKGATVMVTSGERAGMIGKVEELEKGTFSRTSVATVSSDAGSSSLSTELLMVIDQERLSVRDI